MKQTTAKRQVSHKSEIRAQHRNQQRIDVRGHQIKNNGTVLQGLILKRF